MGKSKNKTTKKICQAIIITLLMVIAIKAYVIKANKDYQQMEVVSKQISIYRNYGR